MFEVAFANISLFRSRPLVFKSTSYPDHLSPLYKFTLETGLLFLLVSLVGFLPLNQIKDSAVHLVVAANRIILLWKKDLLKEFLSKHKYYIIGNRYNKFHSYTN